VHKAVEPSSNEDGEHSTFIAISSKVNVEVVVEVDDVVEIVEDE